MVMMNCRECEPTHECIACVCERLKTRVAELEAALDVVRGELRSARSDVSGYVLMPGDRIARRFLDALSEIERATTAKGTK
jgi:hypothetical protein